MPVVRALLTTAIIHPKDMADFATGGGLGLGIEKRAGYINWIAEREKGDYYDRYFNNHYDFCALGEPPGEDARSDVIRPCEQIVAGTANIEIKPSAFPGALKQNIVTIERTAVSFNSDGIFEPKSNSLINRRLT